MGRFGKPLCNGGFRRHRGGFAPAWAADVVSSNIVGYEKVDLTDSTYMMSGVQFVGVGQTAVGLNDLFSGEIEFGTRIMFFNETTGGYDTFKYLEDAYIEATDEEVAGWADRFGDFSTETVANGTGFWFYPVSGDTTVTQSGQVDQTESVNVSVPAEQYTMVINPFPTGFNPNSVSWSDGLSYGDRIMTLGAGGSYVTYRYLEDAYDESTDEEAPGWADRFGDRITSDIAGVGEGFWVLTAKDLTITFPSPLQ